MLIFSPSEPGSGRESSQLAQSFAQLCSSSSRQHIYTHIHMTPEYTHGYTYKRWVPSNICYRVAMSYSGLPPPPLTTGALAGICQVWHFLWYIRYIIWYIKMAGFAYIYHTGRYGMKHTGQSIGEPGNIMHACLKIVFLGRIDTMTFIKYAF